jgi:hypothetical protein
VNILELQKMMGHGSVKVTGDVYGHLFPTAQERVRTLFHLAFRA